MITTRRAAIAAALTIVALTIVACGGSTTSSSAPSGGASAAPTQAPESAAPSTAAATPEASTAIALPSFDLSGLVSGLDNVDSYRLTIVSDGETQYEGVVITNPEPARDVTMGDTRFVVIGDEVWMGSGSDLAPAPAEMATAMLAAFDPAMLVAAFAQPGAMFGANELGNEEKNGVQAQHYRVEGSSLVGTLASMPPNAAIDVWIANDGYLVSLSVTGMDGGDFSIDVTDVNDPANVVQRPN